MKTTGFLEKRSSRRGFLIGSALVGSAVAVAGADFVTRPGSAYAQITGCPAGSPCTDGYTEFCCAINNGVNACPTGTFPGGWWRADSSSFCGGGTRYYIDCMQNCCGPDIGNGFCAACTICDCANGCGTRRVYCNYFRYGQCHQEWATSGPIACRVVSCVPPYAFAENACTTTPAVDNATAEHAGNCPPPPPPPPPPRPPAAAVLPSMGAAVATAPGSLRIFARGLDGAPWFTDYDAAPKLPWTSLGGLSTSGITSVIQNDVTTVLVRGGDHSVYERTRASDGHWTNWVSLGGGVLSDPVAVASGGAVTVFARGNDEACYRNNSSATGVWKGWASLGGRITSEPAVAANAAGGILVVARGGDNAICYGRLNPQWSGWSSLGGATSADPVCVADANGFHVFVRGNDHAIWYSTIPNVGTATPWVSLGGGITSDPAAAVDTAGVHVVARGNDNAIWHRTPTTPWASLGGGTPASPVAVADTAGNQTHVLVCGNDKSVYHHLLSGGTWQNLVAGIAPVRALP